MSTLAEIENAIAALPPEQWQEIRHWMELHPPKLASTPRSRALPLVPATGRTITPEQVDDALDAD